MARDNAETNTDHDGENAHADMQKQMYLRFGAMILRAMVVMYWVMFVVGMSRTQVRGWSLTRQL